MTVTRDDVAHGELEALRTEIRSLQQTEVTAVTAALTAIAAIGGIALKGQDGSAPTPNSLAILLVLPIILIGLGLLRMYSSFAQHRAAEYIRDHLWKRLPAAQRAPGCSWEHFLHHRRRWSVNRGATIVHWTTMGGATLLIFVVPAAAAVLVNLRHSGDRLWPIFWADAFVIVVYVVVGVVAIVSSRSGLKSAKSPSPRS